MTSFFFYRRWVIVIGANGDVQLRRITRLTNIYTNQASASRWRQTAGIARGRKAEGDKNRRETQVEVFIRWRGG